MNHHLTFKNKNIPKNNQNDLDIKCPKCKRPCEFKWQQFKNGSNHIRQVCPIHGYIRYAPKIEPYTILANKNFAENKQKNLFEFI